MASSTLDDYNKRIQQMQDQINGTGIHYMAGGDGADQYYKENQDGRINVDADQKDQYQTLNAQLQTLQQQRDNELKVSSMADQGLNPDGSPIKPGFDSLIDPATGLLKAPYQLQAQPNISVDQRAIDEIRNRGLATGPSAWANMAYDKQKLDETDALDKTRQQSAGAQEQNLNALMTHGGVSSGARERMGAMGDRDQMMAAQNAYRQGQEARANIGLQDQTQKNDFLKMTPSLDFQNAQVANANRDYSTNVQKTNIGAALADTEAKRNYDMGTYSEQMKKWAAGKQADAQASSSGGGKK